MLLFVGIFYCLAKIFCNIHYSVVILIYCFSVAPYPLWDIPMEWYQLISTALPSVGTACGADISWYLQPYLLWVHPVELISTALPSVGTPCGADINSPEVAAVVCKSTDPTICYMSASTHIYVSVNKNSKCKLNSDTVKLSCSLRYFHFKYSFSNTHYFFMKIFQ